MACIPSFRRCAQLRNCLLIQAAVPLQRILLIGEEEGVPVRNAAFVQHRGDSRAVQIHIGDQHHPAAHCLCKPVKRNARMTGPCKRDLRFAFGKAHGVRAVLRRAAGDAQGIVDIVQINIFLTSPCPDTGGGFRFGAGVGKGQQAAAVFPAPPFLQHGEQIRRLTEGALDQRIKHVKGNRFRNEAIQTCNGPFDGLKAVVPREGRLIEPPDLRIVTARIRVKARRKAGCERIRFLLRLPCRGTLLPCLRPHAAIPPPGIGKVRKARFILLFPQEALDKIKHRDDIAVVFEEALLICMSGVRGRGSVHTVEHAVAMYTRKGPDLIQQDR